MIRKIALSAFMLSLFSFSLLAQQNTTPDAQSQSTTRMGRNRSMQQRQMADPETRARKMTDRMTQQLGLDQTASQKVYDVTLTHAQKVDAIRDNSDDRKAKAQALKANADDYKAQMKSILTPDQFTKLESMRDKMRHGRGRNADVNDDSGRK